MRLAETLCEILILLDLMWEVYDKDEAGIWKALDDKIRRLLEFMNESAIQAWHQKKKIWLQGQVSRLLKVTVRWKILWKN